MIGQQGVAPATRQPKPSYRYSVFSSFIKPLRSAFFISPTPPPAPVMLSYMTLASPPLSPHVEKEEIQYKQRKLPQVSTYSKGNANSSDSLQDATLINKKCEVLRRTPSPRLLVSKHPNDCSRILRTQPKQLQLSRRLSNSICQLNLDATHFEKRTSVNNHSQRNTLKQSSDYHIVPSQYATIRKVKHRRNIPHIVDQLHYWDLEDATMPVEKPIPVRDRVDWESSSVTHLSCMKTDEQLTPCPLVNKRYTVSSNIRLTNGLPSGRRVDRTSNCNYQAYREALDGTKLAYCTLDRNRKRTSNIKISNSSDMDVLPELNNVMTGTVVDVGK